MCTSCPWAWDLDESDRTKKDGQLSQNVFLKEIGYL